MKGLYNLNARNYIPVKMSLNKDLILGSSLPFQIFANNTINLNFTMKQHNKYYAFYWIAPLWDCSKFHPGLLVTLICSLVTSTNSISTQQILYPVVSREARDNAGSSQHLHLTADLQITLKVCRDTRIMRNNPCCGVLYRNEASPNTNMRSPQNRILRALQNTFSLK